MRRLPKGAKASLRSFRPDFVAVHPLSAAGARMKKYILGFTRRLVDAFLISLDEAFLEMER